MSSQRAIPDGSLVLVTGATGYIGHRVAEAFVREGYRVRITYRTEDKGRAVKEVLESKYGPNKVELYHVPNMGDPHAYDGAIKGVSAVNHVAGDVSFNPDARAVIDNVVAGNTNLLRLAASEPSIKRFVQTSSSTAISNATQKEGFVFSDKVWNTSAMERAFTETTANPALPLIVYSASKAFGEKAAWDFVEKEKPGFVVNTVLPDFTIGPALDDRLSGSTLNMLKALWNGDEEIAQLFLNSFPQQWWVSVEDIALLHLGATIFEDVKNQRLLGFTGQYTVNGLLAVMREQDPTRKLPADLTTLVEDKSRVEADASIAILKRFGQDGWKEFRPTVIACLN